MNDATDYLNQASGLTQAPSATDYLNSVANGQTPLPQAPAATPGSTRTQRAEMGLGDLEVGLGQIAEHSAENPLNWLRSGIRGAIQSITGTVNTGVHHAGQSFNETTGQRIASAFSSVSSEDFDNIVQQREQQYQQARAAAGQTGIDWWRLAGQAANPLNYMSAGGAAETVAGRAIQSGLQGGAIVAAQPDVNSTPGAFWWDKAKGFAGGAALGGTTSVITDGLLGAVRAGIGYVRGAMGTNPNAADAVVNEALRSQGIDPASIDLNVMSGLREDTQDALGVGADVSQASIINRAKAESLPIPMRLTKGMASQDRAQYLDEQALMDDPSRVGVPIAQRMEELNQNALNNLDALGAKGAPTSGATGSKISDTLNQYGANLDANAKSLYDAVRNSDGQSAAMDQFTAVDNIRDAMDTPEASYKYSLLPSNIQKTIDDLGDGKLHLDVARWQNIDHEWGRQAYGASDGSVADAINQARSLLSNAPIQDEMGEGSMQAYQQAKQFYAQKMSLVTPKLPNGKANPNFQPLFKAVTIDDAPPETLMQKYLVGNAPSQASKTLDFLNNIDPSMQQTVGKTYMGMIKSDVTGGATNGLVSPAKLASWANDADENARMNTFMGNPATQTFKNLSDTVGLIKRVPGGINAGNPSGSGQAVMRGVTTLAKNVASGASKLPVIKQVFSEPVLQTIKDASNEAAVRGALNPGVTVKSLIAPTKQFAIGSRALSGMLTAAGAQALKKPPNQDNDNGQE